MLAFVEALPKSTSSSAALRAFAELPNPLDCAEAHPSERPPGADALAERLEQVLLRTQAAPSSRLTEQLTEIARQAESEGWQDILSQAERHLGRATLETGGLSEAEPHYRAAILHGLASGKSALSIRAWSDLSVLLADAGGRAEDAGELADLAWAAVTSHEDPRLRFDVAMGRVSVLRDEGRQDEAIEVGRTALEDQIQHLGSNDLLVASARLNLGAALLERGKISEALQHFRAAQAIEQDAYGPDHPVVATVLGNIGAACLRIADRDCARSTIEQALAIQVAAYGADDPRTIGTRSKRAMLLQRTGESEEALAVFHRIVELEQARPDPNPGAVARALANVAAQSGNLGHLESAERHALASIQQFELAYGPRHPALIKISTMLASIERSRGKITESLARLRQVEQLVDEVLPPDHLARVNPLIELGKTQLAANDSEGASTSGRTALSMLSGDDAPPAQIAEAGFLVARAQGPEVDTSRSLAEDALAAYEALGPGYAAEATEIRAWLQP